MRVRKFPMLNGPLLICWPGHKSSIYTHHNYVVIVSPPFLPTASAASATVRNFVARTTNAGDSDITKVTLFDPENKLVAYSGTFTEGVREVISAWGHLHVLSNDGNVCTFCSLGYVLSMRVALCPERKPHIRKAGHALHSLSISTGAQFGKNSGIGRIERRWYSSAVR